MKIGLVQFSPLWESKKENIDIIERMLVNFEPDTSLLIFPEMTLTGFSMSSKQFAEEIDGLGIKFFMNLSAKLKTDIIAGIIEKSESDFFNSLFHFDCNGLIKAIYRKIHPFSLAEEDKNFSSGKEVVISAINNHKLGLSICYDLRFPELYRLYAKQETEIMINIANWPIKRIEHWKHLLKSRAIENQCFMIGVNRVGDDPFQTYSGSSAIFDPMGKQILMIGDEQKISYANIEIKNVNTIRNKLEFLKDIKLI